jgi:uncharacterized protein (DUF362 family)
MSMIDPLTVVVSQALTGKYPKLAPFHPGRQYPEYGFSEPGEENNIVYDAVRESFRIAELDLERYGKPEWNPLGGLISPGETVLLKPNLVKERHPRDPQGWQYVLTHGSVIRAVADYVWKALDGRGKVILADAPQTDSSFRQMVNTLGLDVVEAFYRSQGLDFELVDLRREEWVSRDEVVVDRRRLPGDPTGTIAFDLGEQSEFCGHSGGGRYYGADYDTWEVNRHHTGGRHEYSIAASAINCDAIVSLPKLKTHKKAGITVSLKNLVGINGDKNWLPHFTEGSTASGGDEHPAPGTGHRLERSWVWSMASPAGPPGWAAGIW